MVDMVAAPPTAAAAAPDDDPSFDLIERHRVVWAAFVENPRDEAWAAVRDLFFEIVDTVPTTPAGHFDKWHYIIVEAAEWGFLKDWRNVDGIGEQLMASFAALAQGDLQAEPLHFEGR
jgi:hypothetical protein